jgi:hypothetical protein
LRRERVTRTIARSKGARRLAIKPQTSTADIGLASCIRPLCTAGTALLLVACGQSEAPRTPPTNTAAAQPAVPMPAASDNADAIIAENDRVIAENGRMIAALREYNRVDARKLQRLTDTCQQKVGGSLSDAGAAQVFACIRSSW